MKGIRQAAVEYTRRRLRGKKGASDGIPLPQRLLIPQEIDAAFKAGFRWAKRKQKGTPYLKTNDMRKLGRAGGKARRSEMTPEALKRWGKAAARARWKKAKGTP